MNVTTTNQKTYSGYLLSVTVDVESKQVTTWPTGAIGVPDSFRLRDTAEALLAAADLLDSLK